MPYTLSTFDSLTLPTEYQSGDALVYAMETPSHIVTLAGGRAWDALRGDRASPASARYELNCLITDTTIAGLQTKEDAILAKDGVRGTLTRKDYSGNAQTVTARMTVGETSERTDSGPLWKRLRLIFDSVELPWVGTARPGGPVTITGSEGDQTATNSGTAPYDRPTFTLTAGSGAVTALSFGATSGTKTWWWDWAGTLAATKSLIINCGTRQITNDGVANYGLTLNASHNQDEWVVVPNGNLTFHVTVTHSGTDPSLSWGSYDAYR